MSTPTKSEVEAFLGTFPGKKGIDIPEHIFDRIAPAAHGIGKQVWGSSAMPEQLQWLHDNGHHTPDAVHKAFGELPHPYAPSISVSEYPQYQKALELYNKHQGNSSAR